MKTCGNCCRELRFKNAHARFCSTRCRVAAHRALGRHVIPAELTSRARWVRWTNKRRNGRLIKLPLTLERRAASVIDPASWTDYATAESSTVGDGPGFVLNGDGLACLDLDHCLIEGVPTAAAQAVLDGFPTAWVEVSPSGTGLHVWGRAESQPGRRTVIDGLAVEFYTRGRYITVTGRTFRPGSLSEQLRLPT